MAGNDDEMFMTRSIHVTPKTTEQNLIVRRHKSVAYVTNNKRLCSTFYTVEANYWQTRSIARPLCNSRATCQQCSCDLRANCSVTWSRLSHELNEMEGIHFDQLYSPFKSVHSIPQYRLRESFLSLAISSYWLSFLRVVQKNWIHIKNRISNQ